MAKKEYKVYRHVKVFVAETPDSLSCITVEAEVALWSKNRNCDGKDWLYVETFQDIMIVGAEKYHSWVSNSAKDGLIIEKTLIGWLIPAENVKGIKK